MPSQYGKALLWAPEESIEEGALQQISNLSSMPFIVGRVGIMPDVHWGKGAPIGTVFATRGTVVPATLGVDIGCGMMAVRTNIHSIELNPDRLHNIRLQIERDVPLGPGQQNNRPITPTAMKMIEDLIELRDSDPKFPIHEVVPYLEGSSVSEGARIVDKKWQYQLGTLGGGNHFIEVTLDEEGYVWGFVHSGSRGIGHKIANHYIKKAQKLCEEWFIDLPDPNLAYIPRDHHINAQYMACVRWLQKYAEFNRQEMMNRVLYAISRHTGKDVVGVEEIKCHHNFAQWEHQRGENLLITRKGCIGAHEGQLGLIPGSMGTSSYVVVGRGDAASFCTAPHGAGRRMSRRKAREQFTMEDFDRDLAHVEVKRDEEFIDELPGAYKDIDLVMEQSKNLVDIIHELNQVVNVKGP